MKHKLLITVLLSVVIATITTSVAMLCYKQIGDCNFWTSLYWCVLGALLSALLTLILIKLFRPKIKIGIPKLEVDTGGIKRVKIPVTNASTNYDAINVQAEVAFIDTPHSYHLKLDKPTLLILPNKCRGDNTRIFQTKQLEEFTIEIIAGNGKLASIAEVIEHTEARLRVRVYAQHSFTGFGKSFEKSFKKHNNTYYEI